MRSALWCTVRTASAAAKASSRKGRCVADACTGAGACLPDVGECMANEGSTATTEQSMGSYDPAPAPTFTTVAASPRASRTAVAKHGRGHDNAHSQSRYHHTTVPSYRPPAVVAYCAVWRGCEATIWTMIPGTSNGYKVCISRVSVTMPIEAIWVIIEP